jgi:hypothetical protein
MIPIYKTERRRRIARGVSIIAFGVAAVACFGAIAVAPRGDIDDERMPDAFAQQTERARVAAELRLRMTPCRPPKPHEKLIASARPDGSLECLYIAGDGRVAQWSAGQL